MLPNYRRCVSCRKVAPKEGFWRIVRVFPSGTVQLDQGMGRSAYLCPEPACLQAAQRKNRLGRALKAIVPDEIYRALWQRLTAQSGDKAADDHSPASVDQSPVPSAPIHPATAPSTDRATKRSVSFPSAQ